MYQHILSDLQPYDAQLVAVSKTRSHDQIIALYQQGQRIFGENRVVELVEKHQSLPQDIEWHMIGHLQSKKVKSIVSLVSLIHSVDSLKLYQTIEKEAKKADRTVEILLQLKIAKEESKYGLNKDQLKEIIRHHRSQKLKHTSIKGLMGMASFVDDPMQVKSEFTRLKDTFDECKIEFFKDDPSFHILSMGMSGDYRIALTCGSNMVRIGSLLFG